MYLLSLRWYIILLVGKIPCKKKCTPHKLWFGLWPTLTRENRLNSPTLPLEEKEARPFREIGGNSAPLVASASSNTRHTLSTKEVDTCQITLLTLLTIRSDYESGWVGWVLQPWGHESWDQNGNWGKHQSHLKIAFQLNPYHEQSPLCFHFDVSHHSWKHFQFDSTPPPFLPWRERGAAFSWHWW